MSSKIFPIIKKKVKQLDEINRAKATEFIESELNELENIFALLIFGFLVGNPAAPIYVSLELLPLMEKELFKFISKIDSKYEPLGELFSIFSVD